MKNQTPTDIDATLEYKCPSSNCGSIHYVTLKQSKVPGFKVVCESCDTVFEPETVDKIEIVYVSNKQVKPENKTEKKVTLPVDLLEKCAKTIESYGFRPDEASYIIRSAYLKTGLANKKDLVKYSLQHLVELQNYDEHDQTIVL